MAWLNGNGRGKVRRDIQVDDLVFCFRVRAVVLVAQSDVEGQVRAEPPVILREKIVGVCAEIVGVRTKLNAALLREAEQKIREIAAGSLLLQAAHVKRGGKSRKRKGAFRVSRRMKALQYAAIVAAKTHIVFAVIPDHRIGNRIRLVEFAARRRIVQAGKGGEA